MINCPANNLHNIDEYYIFIIKFNIMHEMFHLYIIIAC